MIDGSEPSTEPDDPLAPVPDDLSGIGEEQDIPPSAESDAAESAPSSTTDDTQIGEGGSAEGGANAHSSVEAIVADLERTTGERDDYLDALRRTQAEFENYRKRMMKQQADASERAVESLVEKLLPVLDACDGAMRHGATEVEPIFASLLGALEKEGLERVDPTGAPFDPNLHEAVMHEPAAEADDGTVVADVMRPGYSWKGRVVRAAMVKVRG